MLVCAERLRRAAKQAGAEALVFDTCGLVDAAQGGLALKEALIGLLRPAVIFAIQEENELEPLLAPVQRSGQAQVMRFKPSSQARTRGRTARQDYRAVQFARYFKQARLLRLDWRELGVCPAPRFSLNLLVAFEDREGFTQGLGIVRAIDREKRQLTVLTPLGALEGAAAIRLGSVSLDSHER